MDMQQMLTQKAKEAVKKAYAVTVENFEFQPTRKDFEGDITLVVFPLLKHLKGNPVKIGQTIGEYLTNEVDFGADFNVVKGFLNIVLADRYYLDFFAEIKNDPDFGKEKAREDTETILVEYSSPNTNKPLHLGHVRNNLLGYAVAEILRATGRKVYKTQIINDRGIHICKSMVAWRKFARTEADGNRE